jgi:hypothetical protein
VDHTSTFVREHHEDEERHVAVGTTRKSAAMICPTWFARNVFQVWDGGRRWRGMYFATVACETLIPNFSSSPWMRGAPHSGFV